MTSQATVVAVAVKLSEWFPLCDSRGFDHQEEYTITVFPYLAEEDVDAAFLTIRQDFLTHADALVHGGNRWVIPEVEATELADKAERPYGKLVLAYRVVKQDGANFDLEIVAKSTLEVARWAANNLPAYDQIICECYDPREGPNSGWVHISLKPPGQGTNRKQLLSYVREPASGGVVYVPGLRESP